MIDKLLCTLGKVIIKNAPVWGKHVVNHFVKHGSKYAIGGGVAAASGLAYAVGESVGHTKGKKEGTVEQATRDEKKIKEIHEKHESDRKCWNEQKQKYEDLLDEIENKE